MITTSKVSFLLGSVKQILSHQKEIENLKGEKFNVFSILKVESKENDTHSAFLSELLNPFGSHLKGTTFLELFLQYTALDKHLDISSTTLKLEHHIGKRDDEAKTGGRVDIFISDMFHNSVCIENKIYAGDQLTQIERYCNYNNKKNKVIYLNLNGKVPSAASKGELVAGKDFILLSYKYDIIAWLKSCQKESTDTPIIRETIKQYIILLKKMTATFDNQHQKELVDLLMSNFEEAAYVASNFEKAKQELLDKIREEVIDKLNASASPEFAILKGVSINKKFAQIWIKFKAHMQSEIFFGIESFNGDGNFGGDLFVGVFNQDGKPNSYTLEKNNDIANWWYDEKFIEFDGSKINLGSSSLIMKLQTNPDYKQKLIEQIVTKSIDFVTSRKSHILSHISKLQTND